MFATTTIDKDGEYVSFTFELKENGLYQTDGTYPSHLYLSFKCDDEDFKSLMNSNESTIDDCEVIDISYHDKGQVLSEYEYAVSADPSDFSTSLTNMTLRELYDSSQLVITNGKEIRQEGKKFVKSSRIEHDQVIKRLYMDRRNDVTLVIARLLNGKLHSFGVPALSVAEVNFVEIPFEKTIKSGLMSYKYFYESRYDHGELLSSFNVSDDYDDIGHHFNEHDIELYVNRNADFDLIPEGKKVKLTSITSHEFIEQLHRGLIN